MSINIKCGSDLIAHLSFLAAVWFRHEIEGLCKKLSIIHYPSIMYMHAGFLVLFESSCCLFLSSKSEGAIIARR